MVHFINTSSILDSKFFHSLSSWRNSNHDRAAVHRTPFSLEQLSSIFKVRVTRLLQVIWYLSSASCIAFLMRRSKINVKNTEKPTFLMRKVYSILPNRSLRVLYCFVEIWTPLKPKNKSDALIGARYIP